jgi:hypothetical protein
MSELPQSVFGVAFSPEAMKLTTEKSLAAFATANEQIKLNIEAVTASFLTAAQASQGLAAEATAAAQRAAEEHTALAATLNGAANWQEAFERQTAFGQAVAQNYWSQVGVWSQKLLTAAQDAARPINDSAAALTEQLRRPL